MAELGSRIRALRKARDLTQKELAERAGISEISIKTLETGKYSPRGDTLDKLARALDVSVSVLLGEDDILSGPWPASQLRQLDLHPDLLLRYERLWPGLSRDDRSWLLGHLRIMAEAERRIRALEAEARDHPDSALPAE